MKKFFSKPQHVFVFSALMILLIWGAWMYWNNSERRENFQDKLLVGLH